MKWGHNGGDGSYGYGNGEFFWPTDVVVDSADNVYVMDQKEVGGNYYKRVQKFEADGKYLATIISIDQKVIGGTDLVVDGSGNIILLFANGAVKYDSAGNPSVYYLPPSDQESHQYYGIATDAEGYVYLTLNHRVQKFSADGTPVTSWGSWGGSDGQFRYPQGIVVDSQGFVYVVDSINQRIQKFKAVRGSMTVTSSPVSGSILINGEDTHFSSPHTFTDLEPGIYTVALTNTGVYTTPSQDVIISAGKMTRVDFGLTRMTTLTVTSTPDGAVIFIDGLTTGRQTPSVIKDVVPGSHEILVTKTGYEVPDSKTVIVLEAKDNIVDFPLIALPPPPGPGRVLITTAPDGAPCEIRIDGVRTGFYTPATLTLPAGLHSVSLRLLNNDWGNPGPQDVTVIPDEEIAIIFTLIETGSISVTSSPEGAEIFLNGADTHLVTPNELSQKLPIDYQVTVKLTGYEVPAEKTVPVTGGETSGVDFSLTSTQTGSIDVHSSPRGATIFIDGKDTGRITPWLFENIPAGTHPVKLTFPGYQDADQDVLVEWGTVADVRIYLSPIVNAPEFPSAILPAVFVVGFLGAVLCIQRIGKE